MKIKVKSPKPQPEPEKTYSITGLTRDEMEFLRDLTGRFADNPGDGGLVRHFHTHLYCSIRRALGNGSYYEKKYAFTAHDGLLGMTLKCHRAEKAERA
jgi:hypothetical protein